MTLQPSVSVYGVHQVLKTRLESTPQLLRTRAQTGPSPRGSPEPARVTRTQADHPDPRWLSPSKPAPSSRVTSTPDHPLVILPILTTSKALPGTFLREFKAESFQRLSGVPETNQLLPLSARISP